ncbi:MAG TPA: methionine aminotransferase [Candidatus Kapabacteria bacterium]|nr:methionine aminotransferase [Candidatus Kapabacteria bacterium]
MDETGQQREHRATRIRGIGTSVFAEMSALARQYNAVNLGQGFPDFDGPPEIRQAAADAIMAGHNQYAISHGETPLREAIAAHALRFYGQEVDPNTEITATSGATEALFCSALAFIEPGDEVIIFQPAYDSYVPGIRMAGGVPVAVTLHAPEFRFDPGELRAAFTERTRAIYINTPHNPSGTVFTREELELIASLCCEHDVLAITDEVYEHIVFTGNAHHRLATFPDMWERTLTISSGGKSFSLTGWKVGWGIGPAPLTNALRSTHQFAVFAGTTPVQHAIAQALHLPDAYYAGLAADYQARRDFLCDALAAAGLAPRVPEGSYFILANIESTPFATGLEFSRHLVREAGVASIPLDSFYLDPSHGEKYVRFCFCKRWETLEAGAARLKRIA